MVQPTAFLDRETPSCLFSHVQNYYCRTYYGEHTGWAYPARNWSRVITGYYHPLSLTLPDSSNLVECRFYKHTAHRLA